MDSEQAIKIIKDCKEKSFKRTLYTLDEYYEAVDMAIQALEQQPCEDCISRKAAQEAIANELDRIDHIPQWVFDKLDKTLSDLPSVTLQQKVGSWNIGRIFPTKIGGENLIEYRCSECDRVIRCTQSQLVNYPYCHCGAKMGVEE